MQSEEVYHWLLESGRRTTILGQFDQPLTVKQISRRTSLKPRICSHVLWEMVTYQLVRCLNGRAQRSRLYWLTDRGLTCQHRLRKDRGLAPFQHGFPVVDWETYGWICHRHREAVIRALIEPMQPAAIKRRARIHNPLLRMSANNTRDIVRLYLQRGLVQPVPVRGRAYRRYELTDTGRDLRTLLIGAEVMP